MAGPIEAVETPGPAAPPPRRAARFRAWLPALLLAAAVPGGCGFVPRKKLDECHNLTVTLRAENTRLKDVALDLRSQNQDLTQRAVDDAHKIASQDEAIQRLEKSVLAYQSDRDKLAAAFETMKRQVRLSSAPQPSASSRARLEAFAAAHAGWNFDATAGALSVPADRLFDPSTSRLKEEASAVLSELAETLGGAAAAGQTVELVGRDGSGEVRRTALGEGDEAAPGRFLAAARAARVRDALAASHGLDPARVRLAPPPAGDDPAGGDATPARIEVRLAADLDAGPAGDK